MSAMTEVALPTAKDTTALAVRAGEDYCGKPQPTAREVQDCLDMYKRIGSYLHGAGQQWIVDNGIPGVPAGTQVYSFLDPEWHDDLNEVLFKYSFNETRWDVSRGELRIPIEDLLPEFGNALALMRALSS